ncbi:hypothetical protein RhiirC2_730363 [Rhizophagus irregularis]|uniref:Uncharacterized protein n=1 Tax=Rhizophagus irregularis TaxID=588596 RepID=A0A2N1NWF8_9GLOM|nr:hypothetical protein RhiirC2_730363 [Rhizophagus irregularis]
MYIQNISRSLIENVVYMGFHGFLGIHHLFHHGDLNHHVHDNFHNFRHHDNNLLLHNYCNLPNPFEALGLYVHDYRDNALCVHQNPVITAVVDYYFVELMPVLVLNLIDLLK